jgi:hypothetical protein
MGVIAGVSHEQTQTESHDRRKNRTIFTDEADKRTDMETITNKRA